MSGEQDVIQVKEETLLTGQYMMVHEMLEGGACVPHAEGHAGEL